MIGPNHVCSRSAASSPRTLSVLLHPKSRLPLNFGMAPFFLGRGSPSGIRQLFPFLSELHEYRRKYIIAECSGKGQAALHLRPRESGADNPEVVVVFALAERSGTGKYVFPLWNLCWWQSGLPENWFDAEILPYGRESALTGARIRWTEE